MLVTKKKFYIENFTFENGETIPITIGYETYGTLNENKDNVILVPHYFSGSSHVAGKYNENDEKDGYWNELIGDGKAIDTLKFFVVSFDNLCNIRPFNENVFTTGPATINPTTGAHYGLAFPVPTISDIVNTEKILLESLNIFSVHAIVGASFGGMIGWQWAVDYPLFAKRIIPVVANHKNPVIASINICQHSIRSILSDKNFNNGDYYNCEKPIDGFQMAVQIMNINSYTSKFMENTYGKDYDKKILQLTEKGIYEDNINTVTTLIANVGDPNHWIYTCKMAMNHDISRKFQSMEYALREIKAEMLLISCTDDLIQANFFNEEAADMINKLGGRAKVFSYKSDLGHVSGILETKNFEFKIKNFLEK